MARATTSATRGAKAAKKRGNKQAGTPAAKAGPGAPAKRSAKRVAAKKSAAPAAGRRAPAKTAAAKAAGGKAAAGKEAAGKRPSKSAPRPAKARARGDGQSLDKFLTDQRTALEAERDSYLAQAESLKAEADQMAQEAEPGDVQFDEESGEGGTMNIDRERDLALSAQARAAVEDIDVALGKIADGTYGTCEGCGQPIPKARLKALPQARLCVACKSGGLSRR